KDKNCDSRTNTRTVVLPKGKDGLFGVNYIGNSIRSVKAGWPAEVHGVKRGDQIISMNEVNVESLSFVNITDLFKTARTSGRITMVFRINPERLKDMEMIYLNNNKAEDSVPKSKIRTVTLHKDEYGLQGFFHSGTTISHVRQLGPAGRAGVKEGDQIVSINGVKVETHEDVMEHRYIEKIRDVDTEVRLVLRHNPE
ncbi:hypothetical protein PENTCL1PPCAC_10559, partial [Pristionchus entomophagus]